MKTIVRLIIISCLAVVATACGAHRGSVAAPGATSSSASSASTRPGVGVAANYANPFEAALAGYGDWTSLRVPVSLRVIGANGKNLSLSATATMVRGKSLVLSLRVFGMEMGKAYVDGHEVTVIDKVNKQYLRQPLDTLLGGFDVNISNLQDLLTGRMFILGRTDLTGITAADFMTDTAPDGLVIYGPRPQFQPDNAYYGFALDDAGLLLRTIVSVDNHTPAACIYADPQATDHGIMAATTTLEAYIGKNKENPTRVEFGWNLSKARWDDPADQQPFEIPSGYTRRTAAEMLKAVGKAM